MTEKEFIAFKKAWENYPSQDNEGFVPDRGGFKCGWFAALNWERENNKIDKIKIYEEVKEDLERAFYEATKKLGW